MNNSKKRVLVLSTAYYPFVGGAEVAVKEISDRLSNDFEFDVITAKMDKSLKDFERIGNTNIYRVGFGKKTLDKILLPFLGAILIGKLNKDKKYFCIWAIMVTFGSGAGYIFNLFRFILFKKRIPIVLTLQEGDSEDHLTYRWFGLISLSWKMALKMTDKLTAISNFLLNRARKNGYKEEAILVPNGVDLNLFSKQFSLDDKQELQILLEKKADDIFLVTTGRLAHKNGLDNVIEALVHLPKRVIFIVIGKGDEGSKLQKKAKDLGVADRVKFLGFLDYNSIPRYLSICDIFIRPSRSEGFGNSFIEAMASGLPVIATPVGGIPDFIDDKETGIFCSPDNPQSIVRSVNMVINDHDLCRKIVKNAYSRVIEKYSWDCVAKEMKNVFDKIN